jgi:hypothetical protein
MGIASKMSFSFIPKGRGKGDGDTVLSSPDTRFGADVLIEAQPVAAGAGPMAPGGSAARLPLPPPRRAKKRTTCACR